MSTRALDLVGIYEDEIEKEDRRKYNVTLPHEYSDGTPVNVLLSGTQDILHIERLPDGLEPGSSISLIVTSSLHDWVLETNFDNLVTLEKSERSFPKLSLLIDIFWIAFSAALLSFSVASFTVTTFADMEISEGCLAENPKDSSVTLRKMYFLLFKGFCSSPLGSTNANNEFCISWTEYDAWKNIDSVIRSEEKMSISAKVVWPVAQVLSILGFIFLLFSLISQAMALIKWQKLFTNRAKFYYITLFCVLLAFICSLVTILEVEFSATLKETLWETFFSRSTFSNALAGDTASDSLRIDGNNPCVVLTSYRTSNEGMLFLVLVVPLSFLLFWWILGLKVIKPMKL